MNKVVLIGRLTRDPELRYTGNNTAVASFTLAVNRPFSNQQGEREADFINVVVWRKQAENVKNYLSQGSQAAVEGRLETRTYDDINGQKRFIPEVIAEAKEETVTQQDITSKIASDENIASKTVLGPSDDDDFSEFFGDSVIVEHSDTKYRTRKIEVSDETDVSSDTQDDKQPTDAFEVISQEHGKKGRTVVIIGVAAFLSLFFNLLIEVFHIQVFSSPKTFYGISLALILLSVLADVEGFFKNLKNLVDY